MVKPRGEMTSEAWCRVRAWSRSIPALAVCVPPCKLSWACWRYWSPGIGIALDIDGLLDRPRPLERLPTYLQYTVDKVILASGELNNAMPPVAMLPSLLGARADVVSLT
jgi:hypothetical protein